MENIHIKKGGLRQCVSRLLFEQKYKPSGWEIDNTEVKLDEVQEVVKTLASEGEVLNFFAMKKREPKQFDDGLFKSETMSFKKKYS